MDLPISTICGIHQYPSYTANTHPMITQAKHDIFRPKVYVTAVILHEPCQALASPKWKATRQSKFDSLIKN